MSSRSVSFRFSIAISHLLCHWNKMKRLAQLSTNNWSCYTLTRTFRFVGKAVEHFTTHNRTLLQLAFSVLFSHSMFLQQKLRSTAIVTACSMGTFVGIGVYKNNEVFYDRYLMPMVQNCSPELCHRLAVLGFKYSLFPRQKEIDSDRLVNIIV